MSSDDASQIIKAIASGNAVLVTGAGFSRGATDKYGDPLPLGLDLAKQIWPIAFGNEPFEEASSLGEIFHIANQKAGGRLKTHLEMALTVDPDNLPERYCDWFELPWYRIYTLNLDDLDEVVKVKSNRGPGFTIVSARASTPGDIAESKLAVVHLNGMLRDFPDVTFDPPSYGARTALPDPWYQQFVSDIVSRPTIFIGTLLDEPPIWHYLSQRGQKGNVTETRPRSWLITRNLNTAKRQLLAGFNIKMIEAYEQDFFESYLFDSLSDFHAAAEKRRLEARSHDEAYLLNVADVIAAAPSGDANFLLGREPTWGDVLNGYAAEFRWDTDLKNNLDGLGRGAFILNGDPGCGKTTTMFRLASSLAAEGKAVLWLEGDTARSHSQIRHDVKSRKPDFVFVDDLDRFGDSGPSFVLGVLRDCPDTVFVAAMRTQRLHKLEYFDRLPDATYKRAPELTDADAANLVRALRKGNRLGALLAKSPTEQVEAITKVANRQLLVALIEATSGRKFHDKIAEECRDLRGLELEAYGVICAANAAKSAQQYLTQDDVLIAIDSSNNSGVAAIKSLKRSRLVVDHGLGRLTPRHRVVGESAVDHFRSEGHIQNWVQMLLFLFAVKYNSHQPTRGRYGKLLIRFLNHDFLKNILGSTSSVQSVYGAVEEILSLEFHYWLQRGSFELEWGDLPQAETFLLQAQALAPDDLKVETAMCYMIMKEACQEPKSTRSTALAADGLKRLVAILQTEATKSPHTYTVFLTQGSRWLLSADLGRQEALGLRDDLVKYAEAARRRLPNNAKVQRAVRKWDAELARLRI